MVRDAVNEKPVKSDLPKVDRLTDETIDYTDIPALDAAFLSTAVRPRASRAEKQEAV